MPTSEGLVPSGLPYGSRQQVRQGMQQAGLPLNPSSSGGGQGPSVQAPRPGGSPSPGPGAVLDPVSLLQATTPDQFAFLSEAAPAVPLEATAPGSVSTALAGSAQSSFARAVSERLAQNQQRRA